MNEEAAKQCQRHWNEIGKPLHSLGLMEDLVIQIGGVLGTEDVRLKKAVIVMCADNGVVAEGVTQTGQEVTALVAENMQKGIANVNAMARAAGADVMVYDVGIARDVALPPEQIRKVCYGTANLAKGPAMSREQALAAIEAGKEAVRRCKAEGYTILATGEMGIGNTTTSSAVLSVLLGQEPAQMTGRGAGLSDEGLQRKIRAIEAGIGVNRPDPQDPLDVLAKLGGLDIAGLVGVFLGGAEERIPVVIDGVISLTAALVAARMQPEAREVMLASHMSEEPAAKRAMADLGLEPVIHGRMRLGEGTGAVMLFSLLDMALSVYHQNTTFASIDMKPYEELTKR